MSIPPIDFTQCRLVPLPDGTMSGVKEHAKIGAQALVDNPYFALLDEMGGMKTAQSIIAAQWLYLHGVIDRVIVVAPAAVRSVWYDPELGELAKHSWFGGERDGATDPVQIPYTVHEFHSTTRRWGTANYPKEPGLRWIITNYEFIRAKARLDQLLVYATPKTFLIADESSALKNHQANQTKAVLRVRRKSGRVVLLNGTPISNGPGDMYSQGNIMNPTILDCDSYYHFKAQYAILGGWQQKQIVGWRNVEEIQRRFAPYVLRRLKVDCLDLPEKLPPITLYVALDDPTWVKYKAMRDDLVTWLSDVEASMAPQAITKVMRLAQITSGFLGGVEEMIVEDDLLDIGPRPSYLAASETSAPPASTLTPGPVQEIGREKLDAFLGWLEARLAEDPAFKCVVWSRHQFEIARTVAELRKEYPNIPVGVIAGQYQKERAFALRLVNPATAPAGPAIVVGNPQSGGLGLNMTAAHTMFRMSSDYSHFKRAQSDDRVHRPGQVHAVSYFDLIATGPKGQKTIDHAILMALMNKNNLATMTTAAWVQVLKAE